MAKFSAFVDTLNGNVINGSLWATPFGTVTSSGGAMNIVVNTGAANSSGIDSKVTYDLTESYIFCRLVDAGIRTLASLEVYLVQCYIDGNNGVSWYLILTTLRCYKQVATVLTQVGSNLPYDAAVHKYFRIRESGGTTYWDYSTDGIGWTNHTSTPNPITLTALTLEPAADTYATEASGATVVLDSFNYVPTNKPGNLLKSIVVGNGMSRSEVAN